ncbi:MAG: hypothetical protein ABI686_01095 [Acidobacteriota bacterium]
MSKFVVNLENNQESPMSTPKKAIIPEFGNYQKPEKSRVLMKVLKILGAVLVFILIVGAIGGYFYWRNLKTTPQYSLALLIDAARRDDQKTIDELVDTDAIIDDFVPQITDKAVELYGRGVAPATIQKLEQAAAPFLPALKERAKDELPGLIRDKTQKFDSIPFWAIAVGAGKYLDISLDGDKAFVKSKLPDKPLDLTLKRNGTKWQVIAVKDEILARRIAEKVGQDLITVAQKDGIKKVGEKLGVSNLEDILKNSGKIFK